MTPMWIIPTLEPLEDRHARLDLRLEAAVVQHLARERREVERWLRIVGHGYILVRAPT